MNGDIEPLEFMARRDDWSRGISLYARQVTEGDNVAVASPMELQQHEPDTCITDPFVQLKIQEAQQLMDELWQCGLRPSEGTGPAGSLRATEKHLGDMRKIAFNRLKIEEN